MNTSKINEAINKLNKFAGGPLRKTHQIPYTNKEELKSIRNFESFKHHQMDLQTNE
jgi:hypothetical protein